MNSRIGLIEIDSLNVVFAKRERAICMISRRNEEMDDIVVAIRFSEDFQARIIAREQFTPASSIRQTIVWRSRERLAVFYNRFIYE
jgi:hypothetical protein